MPAYTLSYAGVAKGPKADEALLQAVGIILRAGGKTTTKTSTYIYGYGFEFEFASIPAELEKMAFKIEPVDDNAPPAPVVQGSEAAGAA